MPTPDYRRLFDAVPGCYLVLTPDFTIAGVTDAYLQATMTRREDIIGRPLFEVFPDNPADPRATGTMNLRRSLETVITTGKPHVMAVQKYDIRRPESEGGAFEVRYWSPRNLPVRGGDGGVEHILHCVEDVTGGVLAERRTLEMSTPVVTVRDRVLLMPLVGTIDSRRAEQMTETVLQRVSDQHARALILDMAGVPVMDTAVVQAVLATAQAVRLLGAQTILTGISGSMAKTMIHLGIDTSSLHTCSRLTDAIDMAVALVPAS